MIPYLDRKIGKLQNAHNKYEEAKKDIWEIIQPYLINDLSYSYLDVNIEVNPDGVVIFFDEDGIYLRELESLVEEKGKIKISSLLDNGYLS